MPPCAVCRESGFGDGNPENIPFDSYSKTDGYDVQAEDVYETDPYSSNHKYRKRIEMVGYNSPRNGGILMRNYTELYRMDLPHRAISVYVYLSGRANKDHVCWPSIPTISKELKLSESTTRRALKDLKEAGLVQTKQRYRENGGNSSLMFVLE